MRGFRQFSTSHKMQPSQWHLQKTRNTTRLKRCACHAKWRRTRPKCCACHENCNAFSENVAKVLRLPHKTTFDALQNTSECHEVPHLPRETKQRDVWNLQKWFCKTYYRHGHTVLMRTVADGCRRLRTVATVNATSSEHTLNPQTPRVKREPLLRIWEQENKAVSKLHFIHLILFSCILLFIDVSVGRSFLRPSPVHGPRTIWKL